MKSEIREYKYDNNELQRVQMVTLDNWEDLNFFSPSTSKEALQHLASIYQDFFVKAAPIVFGEMLVFHIPEDYTLPFHVNGIADKHVAAKIYLSKNYKSQEAQKFIQDLKEQGYLYVVKGKNPFARRIMPYKSIGFLSESLKEARMKVNAHFFTFDLFDCATKYDIYGTPLGMMVKDGKILTPPLYHREVLLVDRNHHVSIKTISLKDLNLGIEGEIYERPDYKKTPAGEGYDVIIVGDEIIDVHQGGNTDIPSSGFVIRTRQSNWKPGDKITYRGMEDILFAIQCGNSIMINGKKTEGFISPFYHLFKPGEVQFPPSNYPHNFEKARAPRIAIGNNRENQPVIIWAEGKSKMKYEPGKDSCGASLKEMGDILEDLQIENAINLDGGGSAQILLNQKRLLKISDRDFSNNEESERPVPTGLYF